MEWIRGEACALATRLQRLRRAMGMAAPYRASIGSILLLTMAVAGVNAAEPLVLKWIVDTLTGTGTGTGDVALLSGIGLLAALGIGRELASGLSNWLTWRTRLSLHGVLLEQTVEKLHRMPLGMERREGVGAIMTRLDRSIAGFLDAVGRVLFEVLPSLLYLLIAAVVMFRLDWRLALVALAFVPLPPLLGLAATPEQVRRERSLLDRWARIYSRFNEVLSGLATVRSFAMEDAEKRRFIEQVRRANQVVVRGVAIDTGFGAATNLVVAGARVAAIGVGATLVVAGQTTVGTLVAFLGYLGGLFGPVQGLAGIFQTTQRASVSLEEIFSILDLQEHLGDAPDAVALETVEGRVEFEDVRFCYEAAPRPAVDGVTLTIAPGEHVAIVGPSGSGKSTLMALLMRFYDPQEGVVRLDGHDLRGIRQSSIRRHVGVVLQDPVLFNDPVRDNIAYGRPGASPAEIEAAAHAAHAHEFILALPEGYDTQVGERGSRLSLGERQRIAIARAFLKDPAILILDEPTAALDADTESQVQEAIAHLRHGRTCLVIAHRLTTVVGADRIVVLQRGRIAEHGTHEELLAQSGAYAHLVRRQVGGLLPNGAVEAVAKRAAVGVG